MAQKWQRFVTSKKRRISFLRSNEGLPSLVANRSHFFVYTADENRHEFPLEYLRSNIFVELRRMSEEEFGLPSDGPSTLPFESMFLEYVIWLVYGHIPQDLEKAVLTSSSHVNAYHSQNHHQNLIVGF